MEIALFPGSPPKNGFFVGTRGEPGNEASMETKSYVLKMKPMFLCVRTVYTDEIVLSG